MKKPTKRLPKIKTPKLPTYEELAYAEYLLAPTAITAQPKMKQVRA